MINVSIFIIHLVCCISLPQMKQHTQSKIPELEKP